MFDLFHILFQSYSKQLSTEKKHRGECQLLENIDILVLLTCYPYLVSASFPLMQFLCGGNLQPFTGQISKFAQFFNEFQLVLSEVRYIFDAVIVFR